MDDDVAEQPGEPPAEESVGLEPARDLESKRQNELPQEPLPPEQFLDDFEIPSPGLGIEPDDEAGSPEEDDETEPDVEREAAEEGEEDHPAILRIDDSLLARARQVFVEPSGYGTSVQEQRERIVDSQLYIVYGEEHAGKLTCALNLAQDLLKGVEKKIYCYRHRPDESPSLLDLVGQEGIKKDRAYIIEDAFPNVSSDDLVPPFLHLLNEKLKLKESFLLLTTERSAAALPAGVAKVRAAVQDRRQQVFLNHLTWYETDETAADRIVIEKPALELARKSWDALKADLKDPDQIDEFCRLLGVCAGVPTAATLTDLAGEIARRRIEASRPWFASLQLHEKLFAFLVVLFPGRDGRGVYEIFLDVVGRLRGQGTTLIDPREVGYNDLLDRIRAVEGPTREIGFQERAIGVEVDWQVKNYNHLLWSLVPWFVDEIEKNLGRGAGEIRRSRAAAVGRIGLHQPAQLREQLRTLAKNPANEVAAATGYALSEVCLRDADADQEVWETLRAWATTRESRLMWTASSCIWRVYGALTRRARDSSATRARLLDVLESLISGLEGQPFGDKSRAKQNRASALYAVEQIAAADPRE